MIHSEFMTTPDCSLVNLTLEQVVICFDAIGKHVVDSRCTCFMGLTGEGLCEQCLAFFVDGPPDSYEKAIEAEAKRFWEEHAR